MDSYLVDPLIVTEPIAAKVVEKFKSLRLEVLHTSPPSYLSTSELEGELTNAPWKAAILDPNRRYLVCHKPLPPTNNTEFASDGWAENDAWVGILCLLGPYTKDDYAVASLVGSTATEMDNDELGWHLTALYLQPSSTT